MLRLVFRSKFYEIPSSNRSICPSAKITHVLLYICIGGDFFLFWFTTFNIVTNIVYKSINFAMCQFMRFSATHFMYSLIIDECMRIEIRILNFTTNYETSVCVSMAWFSYKILFVHCVLHFIKRREYQQRLMSYCYNATLISPYSSILMHSYKNNKCCRLYNFDYSVEITFGNASGVTPSISCS